MMTTPITPPPVPVTRSALTMGDLTQDLLWPKIFQSARLALDPGRMLLALGVVVLVFLLDSLAARLGAPSPGPFQALLVDTQDRVWAYLTSRVPSGVAGVVGGVGGAGEASTPWRWTAILPAIPALGVVVIGTGAICRSVVCEFSARVRLSWAEALGFALGRAYDLLVAQLAPLLAAGVLLGALRLGRWLFVNETVAIAGGIFYGVVLAIALVAAVVLTLYILGQFMLAPAVAADGADGLGAIERAYAYALARPGRLVLYVLIAVFQAWLATLLLGAVLLAAGTLAAQFTGAPAAGPGAGDAPAAMAWPAHFVGVWHALLTAVGVAYLLSFYSTASSIVYLLLRRLCDGQDEGEIWMPGLIESTMAATSASRADAPTARPE